MLHGLLPYVALHRAGTASDVQGKHSMEKHRNWWTTSSAQTVRHHQRLRMTFQVMPQHTLVCQEERLRWAETVGLLCCT